jgi:type IV pilus assembly protein PilM
MLIAWDVVDFAEDVEDLASIQRYAHLGRAAFHFRSRHKLTKSHVWASVRGESAFVRTVVVPPVNDESLDRILEFEAQQQVPHPLSEVYWDRRVLAIREDGAILATIYAVKQAVVEDRVRKLRRAGVPVDGAQLRPVALQNFCAFERLLDHGTVVVDVDYAHVHVLIHHDDQTWFRVLPIGAVDLVERIRESFDVKHRNAVKIASGEEPAPDAKLYSGMAGEVAQDIVDEVDRTIRYYFATRPALKPSGIVLFNSHVAAPQIRDALKRTCGLSVFTPKGFRHLEVDTDVVSAGIQENFPALAKAVGLALQGVGRADVDIKIFPTELTRDLRRGYIGLWIAAASIILALVVGTMRLRGEADRISSARTELAEVVGQAKNRGELESQSGMDTPIQEMQTIAQAAAGRTGPLPWVIALWTAVQEAPKPSIVVSISYDRTAPTRGSVILATPLTPGENPKETLLQLANALVGKANITAVTPRGESWVAPDPCLTPPTEAETRILRERLYHQAFEILQSEES